MVVYDPLDGSQNIPVNLTTGLIYGILEVSLPCGFCLLRVKKYVVVVGFWRAEQAPQERAIDGGGGLLRVRCGDTIHSCRSRYSEHSNKPIQLSLKLDRIDSYTLHPLSQKFVLTKENHKLPYKGKIYACNEV